MLNVEALTLIGAEGALKLMLFAGIEVPAIPSPTPPILVVVEDVGIEREVVELGIVPGETVTLL